MISGKENLLAAMCGGPEHSNTNNVSETDHVNSWGKEGNVTALENHQCKLKESRKIYSIFLELAAENDVPGFKQSLKENVWKVEEVSYWYGRKLGTGQMILEQRTPVMIAALFGSVDVLSFILSTYETCGLDINRGCGTDNSTALHCAAAGGSVKTVDTVRLLIQAGADVNRMDAFGRRPADVIAAYPKLQHKRSILEEMLNTAFGASVNSLATNSMLDSSFSLPEFLHDDITVSSSFENPSRSQSSSPTPSPPLSSSPVTSFASSLSLSPQLTELSKHGYDNNDKKEYPIDPSLPDIKNSIYTTDEFRMYSFKVRPCSRAYSHDWTECPFVHPGENARRRDPRRFHYSCVPCPEFRKGSCRRGDACEYAHGVFESWLHPAQYRTRLCKDGTSCARRVCFFAHRQEELRPLYVSTGSAVPSPRMSASMDMVSSGSPLAPGSPSSVLMMSPFSPSNPPQTNLFTPPMSPSSPSANKTCHANLWSQSSLPSLHIPGCGSQTSRLRSTLSARDLPLDALSLECDNQMMSDFSPLTNQARMNAAALSVFSADGSSSGKYKSYGLTGITPSNLDDLFASEMSMPGMVDLEPSLISQMGVHMQSGKAIHSQLPNHKKLSINTQVSQPTTQMQQIGIDPQSPGRAYLQSSMLSPSYSLSSLGRMSSFNGDIQSHASSDSVLSPVMSPKPISRLSAFSQQERRGHSSRDLGANHSPTACTDWGSPTGKLDWGSPTGKLDWGVNEEELTKFRKSRSFACRGSNEQGPSWIPTSAKESTDGGCEGSPDFPVEPPANGHLENPDPGALSAWMDNICI